MAAGLLSNFGVLCCLSALLPWTVVVAQEPAPRVLATGEQKEVQAAIKTGNASNVAVALVKAQSITGVSDGLRIPEGADELAAGAPLQETDPDVVAVKGVARAILEAADTDINLIDKLVEAIKLSAAPIQAPRFCTTGGPNRTDWWYAHVGGTQSEWVRGTDAKCLGNMTFNAVAWGEELCVSGFNKTNCEANLKTAIKSCRPVLKEIAKYGVNKDPHVCGIVEHEGLVDRAALKGKLRDRELMLRVQDDDPVQAQNRRRLMRSGSRSLSLSGARSHVSFYCARCWPKEICEDSFVSCRRDDNKGRKRKNRATKGKGETKEATRTAKQQNNG